MTANKIANKAANKKSAIFFVAALVFSFGIVSARAQAPTGPIVIKSGPAPQVKPIKVRYEVLRMMINAIQVRSLADSREIHTFIYSDRIRDRMQAIFNAGGYQYGDRIVIHSMPGSDVALSIQGKASKPI